MRAALNIVSCGFWRDRDCRPHLALPARPWNQLPPPDKRAEWILFPAAVEGKARGVANLDTLFRREFILAATDVKGAP